MIIAYLINEQFSYIMATIYIRWDDDDDDDDDENDDDDDENDDDNDDDDDVRFVLD